MTFNGILAPSATAPATAPTLILYRDRGVKSVIDAIVCVESQILNTTSPAVCIPFMSTGTKYTLYCMFSGGLNGGSHLTTMEDTLSIVVDSTITFVGGGGAEMENIVC